MKRVLGLSFTLLAAGCLGTAEGEPTPAPRGGTEELPAVAKSSTLSASLTADALEGLAPLATTLRFHANDAQGVATCSLDADGDGSFERHVHCNDEQLLAVTFEKAGSVTVQLRVEDESNASAETSLALEVRAPPLPPPTIVRFAVTPSNATVPATLTFAWAVSAEGAGLSCTLDVGNNGSAEYSPAACSEGSQTHLFTTAGTFPVAFRVRDENGLSAEKVLTVTTRAPAGDVRVSKVEWGQSILSESLRLVAGKPALLRAHVLADRANLANVAVKAELSVGESVVETLVLTGPATLPLAEAPGDLQQSFTAVIPAARITPGLKVRVIADPDDAISESDESNNEKVITPAMGIGNVLHVTAVPVIHQGKTGTVPDYAKEAVRIWPLREVTQQTRAPFTFSGTITANDGDAWSSLLQALQALRRADGSGRYYYGFVPVTFNAGIFGLGYIGQPVATGVDRSVSTYVHELGHNLGRPHAPCGGVANPDPNFPYANARLGTYGYDAYATTAARIIRAPSAHADLMAYCNPSWVSDYNYNLVQTFLERSPPKAAFTRSEPQPLLLLSGRILQGRVSLAPMQRFVGVFENEEGPLQVEAVTTEGTRRSLSASTWQLADSDEEHFTVVLPDDGELASLEFHHFGVPLYTARPARRLFTAPSLEETQGELALEWNAAAYAMVTHVAVDGERTTLALWLEGGRASLPTLGVPSGGHWDVSISDGLDAQRFTFSRKD